jgi:hypothetical protein
VIRSIQTTKIPVLAVALLLLCHISASSAPPQQTSTSSAFLAKSIEVDPSSRNRKASDKPLGDHYLMLVNTAIAFQMTEDKLRQFDKSSYDGIAIAPLHAYDVSAPPSVATMDQQIAQWKKYTSKDIWPWVYVNRMISMNVSENNHYSDNPYFKQIAGIDVDDKRGALSDFMQIWRNSLSAARDSNEPGIIFDFEFYNNYKEYDIGEVARLTGKTPADAAKRLKAIGATMADSAAELYPNSMLWLFATGLTHQGYKKYDGVSYYPSPTYFVIGMLDEIRLKTLPLKLLAGGEGSLGYCHPTVDEFKQSIQKRQLDLAVDLQKYSGILELGGTLAVWSDQSAKKDWLNQGNCNASNAATIEDLQPYIELMMTTYRYNWIYGTGDGNYYPFSPTSAPRFDAVIQKARVHSGASSPQTH